MSRCLVGWLLVACTAIASAADGALMAFEGTVSVGFMSGALPAASVTGTGVADVNPGGFDVSLHTLVVAGGVSGSQTAPVSDPEVAFLVGSVQLQAALGGGTLSPFSATLPSQPLLVQNQVPIGGALRLCLIFSGCSQSVDIPLTVDAGQIGLGVGGVIANGSQSGQIIASFRPWTIGTAWISVSTQSGATVALPTVGWVHGPLSFSGSTALTGAALQLVSPMRILSPLLGSQTVPAAATLRLRFVPEPDLACLITAGAVGLSLLARRRPLFRRR